MQYRGATRAKSQQTEFTWPTHFSSSSRALAIINWVIFVFIRNSYLHFVFFFNKKKIHHFYDLLLLELCAIDAKTHVSSVQQINLHVCYNLALYIDWNVKNVDQKCAASVLIKTFLQHAQEIEHFILFTLYSKWDLLSECVQEIEIKILRSDAKLKNK